MGHLGSVKDILVRAEDILVLKIRKMSRTNTKLLFELIITAD